MQHAKLGETDPAPYRDAQGNRTIRMGAEGTLYRGYLIETKRDLGKDGFLISGHRVKHGYVVTDGGMVNVMPAATWFLTVFDAMTAIDDLITSQSLGRHADGEHPFWALRRFRQNAEERAPELATLLDEVFQHAEVRLPGDLCGRIRDALGQIDANCDRRDTVTAVNGKSHKIGPRLTGRFGL